MLRNKRIWGVGLVTVVAALIVLAVPSSSVAESHEESGAPDANHFKCYQVLDWGNWEPTKAELVDQFGKSVARVLEPRMLCNPVDKNGEGIVDKESHLVCYSIQDDPSGDYERVKEVEVDNQFYKGPLWVGNSNLLCVPSKKTYQPR